MYRKGTRPVREGVSGNVPINGNALVSYFRSLKDAPPVEG
jgi:hypothetical protein